jgi:FkbM family methyltransferase
MNDFYGLLIGEILNNSGNNHSDNYDYKRFGRRAGTPWKSKIKSYLGKILKKNDNDFRSHSYQNSLKKLSPYLNDISDLYEFLGDEQSKFLLVRLITFRILGAAKYKLPLSTSSYWKGIEEIEKSKITNDFISTLFVGNVSIKLYKYDLNQFNIPIKLYNTATGIYNHSKIKQYEYFSDEVRIKPEIGDIVLDCGACWGDTTLFFSEEIGDSGHIYSFEFIPNNIEIFKKNLDLNPRLKDRVTLVPFPVGETSGKELYYFDNGPGSQIGDNNSPSSSKAKSISLDDFYMHFNLSKVDFIKMDIEGSEFSALKGGIKTIQNFKPKLAISIYHSMDDFIRIPEYLHSLNLGYKFYLKHGTIHQEETVLLAIVKT